MARTASQQLDRIFRQIDESVEDMAKSERLRDLGEFASDMIRNRTRLDRKGVRRPGGSRTGLKGLKTSTKQFRRRYRSFLHSQTSSDISNLTFSGQLLDSLKLRVRRGIVTLRPFGRRTHIIPSNRKRKSPPTNQKVAEHVSRVRPFMNLGKVEQRKLVAFYSNTFEKLLTRKGLTT